MKYALIILVIFFLLPEASISQMPVNTIIPRPVSVSQVKGEAFNMDATTYIVHTSEFAAQAVYLKEEIKKQTGLDLPVKKSVGGADEFPSSFIAMITDGSLTRPEMYELKSSSAGVTLTAAGVRGIVNGIQTILQLLPLRHVDQAVIPAMKIIDYPRFTYRGMHLDVARHFFPVTYIRKYIDYIAFHKFNTFHWHLTDDQGWRIEMLTYKKLNEIGSWRDETLVGHFKDVPAVYDGKRYGGYYTRDEIRDIVQYAAVRGINVIPEIDIPGHSRAIIAAYPELGTQPEKQFGVATTWGMYNRQNNVLAPRPETFQFLKTVFQEVADLFPSPYFHIGGDECSKIWWKKDPVTQQFMKDNGIADETALQTYFVEQVAGYLREKNKMIIGWHEITEGRPDTSALVMNWATGKQAVAAVNKGYHVIMTTGQPLYFDHYQTKNKSDSLSIHGYNPLSAVYSYEPVPAEIKKKGKQAWIIGAQANVWTEYIEWPTRVDYQVFPRMTALSEVLWTPASLKNFRDFNRRLNASMIPRYQFWNASYYKGEHE